MPTDLMGMDWPTAQNIEFWGASQFGPRLSANRFAVVGAISNG